MERSGTGRLEAFSDGVFAIAATLLVLEFTVNTGLDAPPLGHQLLHLWPAYLAYVTSFLTIGIIWINHHSVMETVGRVDRTFMFVNTLLLLVVSFIPFPTRLVAEYLDKAGGGERAAVYAYDATLLLMALGFNVLWTYARRNRRLIGENVSEGAIRAITWAFRPGVPLYVLVLGVAIWSPLTSVILTLVLAAFYLPSAALFGRDD